MARDPRHDVLFEPVRIGPKTLRNRFYQVPHCSGFGVEKPWTQAAHRGVKAEGGWAAVCTEYCSISPESDEKPFVSARLWDDEDARALALMAQRAHEHGALAGIELWHGGVLAENRESRLPQLAPSQLASTFDATAVPRAMTRDDIRRVQDDWVAAARRARAAGFDIVYVYGSHQYLPTQFLSPRFNRRGDAYGGSVENRARFWLEAIERVREAIGDDCAIAVRVAADDLDHAGVEPEDGVAFIELADPLVDVWDLAVGGVYGETRLDSGPSRFTEQGYQLPFTDRLRGATRKPVIGVGRFTDPSLMAETVRSGRLDLIGAARPTISDPFLPRKVEEGRYDEIRECIGCNACYSRSVWGMHLGCTQNATAGEEHRRGWHPERFARAANAHLPVLVVGAGPAGLECAIVLGRRGFEHVHLLEADGDVGGCLGWIPRLPGLGEWGRVLDWRRAQLARLPNVSVVTGRRLSASDVLDYGASLVVVAAGCSWAADGTNGLDGGPIAGADASLPHVFTPEQLMVEGMQVPGERLLVVDYDGYYVGACLAERLAREGRRVELLTPEAVVSPMCDQTLEGTRVRRRLHELAVGTHRSSLVRRIAPGLVEATSEFGDPFEIAADAVVLVTQRLSDDALLRELTADPDALARHEVEAVYGVGDCVAPRLLADAIFDGHRLGREIDGPHPALALPYLRERPLVTEGA